MIEYDVSQPGAISLTRCTKFGEGGAHRPLPVILSHFYPSLGKIFCSKYFFDQKLRHVCNIQNERCLVKQSDYRLLSS